MTMIKLMIVMMKMVEAMDGKQSRRGFKGKNVYFKGWMWVGLT